MIENKISDKVKTLKILIAIDLLLMFISGIVMIFAMQYVDRLLFSAVMLLIGIGIYWSSQVRCASCKHLILNIFKIDRCDNCGVYFES